MGSHDPVRRPYFNDLEPALTVDATVALQPSDETFYVNTLEAIPTVETQTFEVADGETEEDIEIRGLYAQTGVLAQFRFIDVGDEDPPIPEGVRVFVNQGGEESPRFNLKNRRGFYDADTALYGDAAQQTELWQWEDEDLFFDIENDSGDAVEFSIKYTGWAYDLRPEDISPPDADLTVLTERKSLRGN